MTNWIQLEPEAQAFAEAEALSPLPFTLGPQQGRLSLEEAQSSKVCKPAVEREDLTITDGPSAQVALRILRPQHAQTPLPVIVYIHGAGWVFGSPQTHDRLVRELAVGAGAAVVFPVYRLCPEVRYPTALEECYMVAQWVAGHGQEHGLDDERLAVAGDSAGGEHGNGDQEACQGAWGAGHSAPTIVLPGDRCGLRHGVLPAVCRGLLLAS